MQRLMLSEGAQVVEVERQREVEKERGFTECDWVGSNVDGKGPCRGGGGSNGVERDMSEEDEVREQVREGGSMKKRAKKEEESSTQMESYGEQGSTKGRRNKEAAAAEKGKPDRQQISGE